MKIKWDFVTNSSSTAFIITNTTDQKLHLSVFALENIYLLQQFKEQYDWYKNDPRFSMGSFLESVVINGMAFKPEEAKYCVFGDEQGTVVGHVYDYMLRDGGQSNSFMWEFREWLR